jgi:hypothetical protein
MPDKSHADLIHVFDVSPSLSVPSLNRPFWYRRPLNRTITKAFGGSSSGWVWLLLRTGLFLIHINSCCDLCEFNFFDRGLQEHIGCQFYPAIWSHRLAFTAPRYQNAYCYCQHTHRLYLPLFFPVPFAFFIDEAAPFVLSLPPLRQIPATDISAGTSVPLDERNHAPARVSAAVADSCMR